MGLVIAVVAFTTLLALLIISAVTQPLKQLTQALATLSQRGLAEGLTIAPASPLPAPTRDEFGQLTSAFEMLLDVCRRQWNALRRTDHFRREGVSNLSHDLRSPLTATVACLETLDGRWAEAPERGDDRRLVEIALRNTRNAARLVQSLGDLAKLDEPEFDLRTEVVDAGELLDDIALRFAERAARLGVTLTSPRTTARPGRCRSPVSTSSCSSAPSPTSSTTHSSSVRAGSSVVLAARALADRIEICVSDDGPGIPAADLPQLFDRFYQSRQSVAPATGDGGRGLGLAIVKRIAELHGGDVGIESTLGIGTRVTITLPVPGA